MLIKIKIVVKNHQRLWKRDSLQSYERNCFLKNISQMLIIRYDIPGFSKNLDGRVGFYGLESD